MSNHSQMSSNTHPDKQAHEPIAWHAQWRVEKYYGDWRGDAIDRGLAGEPYAVLEREGNLLMYGGASAVWDRLIGANNVSAFDNTNAHLGVGDGTTTAAATQSDLQGTNKVRAGMDSSYPAHTDGTVSGSASVVLRSVFGASEANFDWEEWGVFNAASGGRMLNRKVTSLGTKPNDESWVLTVTLSLA